MNEHREELVNPLINDQVRLVVFYTLGLLPPL